MRVAVGVIFDFEQRVLITRRSWEKSHGGFWEFPGGKLEENETPQTALAREIKEEVGVHVLNSDYLGEVYHDYGDRQVCLIVFAVHQFSGEPVCRESQLDMCWVKLDKLVDYQFPEANLAIIQLINKFKINSN